MDDSTGQLRALAAACVLAAAGLAGCANPSPPADPMAASRDGRERLLQQRWIGRTRLELVSSFGEPSTVMNVPGGRLPESIILVYRNKDSASGCIDAFVVLRDSEERIWNYFCR